MSCGPWACPLPPPTVRPASVSRIYNTEEEIDYVLAHLPKIIADLRAMSPFWAEAMKSQSGCGCGCRKG